VAFVGINPPGAEALGDVLDDSAGRVDGVRQSILAALGLADVGSQLPAELAQVHEGLMTLASGVRGKAADSEPLPMVIPAVTTAALSSSLFQLTRGPGDGAGDNPLADVGTGSRSVGPRGFVVPVDDPGITLVADGPRSRGPVTAGILDARTALEQAGLSEADIPRTGAKPLDAAVWWGSLSRDQQALYQGAFPGRIGALDGLPATDRHAANMTALREMIEAQQEVSRTALENLRIVPWFMGVDQMRLDRLTGLLGRLEAAEQNPDGTPMFLLGIDDVWTGRAIVSIGNPDTARHLGVLVPGILVNLSHMSTLLERADLLRTTALSQLPENSGNVAVVAWLGYYTPTLTEAIFQDRAEEGAPWLRNFITGTRVSSQLDPGLDGEVRIALFLHSYAAVVAGIAASRDGGLGTDVTITVGAPGMTVSDATRLMLRGPVYSGAFDGEFVSSWGPLFHNTAPHTWEFGGNRFVVDATDHSGYWEPGSVSVANQVRAWLGDYDAITPDLTDLTRRSAPDPAAPLGDPPPSRLLPFAIPPLQPTDPPLPPADNLLGPRRSDVAPGEFQTVPGITVTHGSTDNYTGYTPADLTGLQSLGWTGILSGQSGSLISGGNFDPEDASWMPTLTRTSAGTEEWQDTSVTEGWQDARVDWAVTGDSSYDMVG